VPKILPWVHHKKKGVENSESRVLVLKNRKISCQSGKTAGLAPLQNGGAGTISFFVDVPSAGKF